MIEEISIKNFKSARDLKIPTKALNVFTGLNGSGKSTTLQTIALIRQSLIEDRSKITPITGQIEKIKLKGDLLELGTIKDVFSQSAKDSIFEIGIKYTGYPDAWTLSGVIDESMYDSYDILLNSNSKTTVNPIQIEFQNSGFQFLQADRITPATHYKRGDTQGFLGAGGQFTPEFLVKNGSTLDVNKNRHAQINEYPTSSVAKLITNTTKLNDQLNLWMQHISPGINIDVTNIRQTDLVTLGYAYTSTTLGMNSDNRRPTNVGFGITYSLPIIVACLSAPRGAILLLENPEAHLHPKGQFAIGELISKTAADGVQIFLETHSDHIMNGIRYSARKKFINHEDVFFHHYTRSESTGDSSIESPYLDVNGSLSDWPVGFFDEWENSIEKLLK